jgi:hypothetical protein
MPPLQVKVSTQTGADHEANIYCKCKLMSGSSLETVEALLGRSAPAGTALMDVLMTTSTGDMVHPPEVAQRLFAFCCSKEEDR